MRADANRAWLRADAWPPALVIVAPFVLNKLIYASWPSYQVFLITDYTCHMLGRRLVYLLLRNSATSLSDSIPSYRSLSKTVGDRLVGNPCPDRRQRRRPDRFSISRRTLLAAHAVSRADEYRRPIF